jgi:hypothetical protein
LLHRYASNLWAADTSGVGSAKAELPVQKPQRRSFSTAALWLSATN